MDEYTIVNAGFVRHADKRRGLTRDWVNLQNLYIPLPETKIGEKDFTRNVTLYTPGPHYVLQGYCPSDLKKNARETLRKAVLLERYRMYDLLMEAWHNDYKGPLAAHEFLGVSLKGFEDYIHMRDPRAPKDGATG